MGSVPMAIIPHPLAGNKPDEVQKKAEAIAEEVIAILTHPADQLAREYREKFLKQKGISTQLSARKMAL